MIRVAVGLGLERHVHSASSPGWPGLGEKVNFLTRYLHRRKPGIVSKLDRHGMVKSDENLLNPGSVRANSCTVEVVTPMFWQRRISRTSVWNYDVFPRCVVCCGGGGVPPKIRPIRFTLKKEERRMWGTKAASKFLKFSGHISLKKLRISLAGRSTPNVLVSQKTTITGRVWPIPAPGTPVAAK